MLDASTDIMKQLILALVAAAASAGCVEADATAARPPIVVLPGGDGAVGDAQASDRALSSTDPEAPETDVCALLPLDGACSLACDYDALVQQYVQKGSCATFFCRLSDGRSIVVDACHI